MPISQAGMSILEEKISPFSNLKTVITVLEMYGLTRNTGSVTIYDCGSCFCGNWILCLEIHNCFAVVPTVWSVTVHSSSVTDWLTDFRRSEITISLKLMPHLWHRNGYLPVTWYLPGPVQRPTVEDESVFSSGWGPCFPVFLSPAGTPTPTSHLAPPDEPQCWARAKGGSVEHHPPKILTSLIFLRGWVVIFEPGEDVRFSL